MIAQLGLATFLTATAPEIPDRVRAYEQALLAEVEALAPAALQEARAASEAYLSGNWQESFDHYGRVLKLAPGFSHALRRQCTCRLRLGERAAATALCRRAVALARLPENLGALATALAWPVGRVRLVESDRDEATRLIHAAVAARPDDVGVASQACEVALHLGDWTLLRGCSDIMLRGAPREVATQQFAALAAATRGEYGLAREHLALARRAGLPPAIAERLERIIDDSEPAYRRYGPTGLVVLAAWALGLLLLLGAGAVLSSLTLRGAVRMASAPPGRSADSSLSLRRVYRAVLALCCAYYYLSVPLVLLAVLGLGGGALYGLLAVGRVPVKLLLIIGLVVLVTGWAILKAVWVSIRRPEDADPGARVGPGVHPLLDQMLDRVARRIGTRPVDSVFLAPGTEVAVFERGSLAKQVARRQERCLILGVGVLDGMRQGELQAVLAHEYGHLVNRDTAGGGLALSVRRSIREMGETMARGGAATWYNPAWWFVKGFHRVFLRVSQGASRLQEILADRWAADAYGGANFARGLRHVIERSIRFDRHAQASLKEVIEGGRALANLYRYEPSEPPDEAALGAAVDAALAAAPSPYDSHPRPIDRITWVAGIAAAEALGGDSARPAWDLFSSREEVEHQMTDLVRTLVERNNGVTIRAEQTGPSERTTSS